MAKRKLGRPSDQRKAILRTLTTALIWNGRIETTHMRAKEVRPIAEKLITLAVKEYDKTVTVKKDDGKTYTNDMPSKLQARRIMMSYLYDVQEPKKYKESKSAYAERTKDVKHPVIEKLFREIGPKYRKRAEQLGQGGGYTRIIKTGNRRGDAAPTAIIELV